MSNVGLTDLPGVIEWARCFDKNVIEPVQLNGKVMNGAALMLCKWMD